MYSHTGFCLADVSFLPSLYVWVRQCVLAPHETTFNINFSSSQDSVSLHKKFIADCYKRLEVSGEMHYCNQWLCHFTEIHTWKHICVSLFLRQPVRPWVGLLWHMLLLGQPRCWRPLPCRLWPHLYNHHPGTRGGLGKNIVINLIKTVLCLTNWW